jgi:uncharacterized membrane protein YjfL (UPF0719 family)
MFDVMAFLKVFINTMIYTAFGLVTFLITFTAIVKAAPFSVRKEIEEDQNIALAIIIGSVILGIALIIALAITG